MKPICKSFATALAALLAIPLLAAPRPLAWRADFPSARVENFPVRHGTDVDFRPTWYVNGSPADTNGWTYSLSVQTNGAPAGEWATITGTVFSHTNDCGAEAYNVLVRAVDRDGTVDYSAAARLRMLPSPGFMPGALPPAATFQESDPVFSAWLSTFAIPEPGDYSTVSNRAMSALQEHQSLKPSTNYTDRALSSFAATGTVFRSDSYGTPTRWSDATGCVWRIEEVRVCTNANEAWTYTIGGINYTAEQIVELSGGDDNYSRILSWENSSFLNSESESEDFEGWYAIDGSGTAPVNYNYQTGIIPNYASDHFLAEVEYETYLGQTTATRGHMATVTNLVGRVAYTNDLPTTPSAVGAAPASIVPVLASVSNDAATAKLNADTALRIVLGESVWFAVTNYMRTAQGVIPSLQLWEVRGGATNLVYDSREEITNTVRALTQELRDDMTDRIHGVSNAIPSKAWGNYQSDGTDNPQPGEVAIVNPPTVILTGGGTFKKYLTVGDSSVWVLKASGPVSFGGDTNGNFLAVIDDDGREHFKVAKTDSYDLPAIVNDILPRQHMNSVLLYTATTNRHGNAVQAHPILTATDDLKESAWHEESEGEIDALGLTVSWTRDDTISAWVATITQDVWHPKLFLRAKVSQEGGVAVINTAPARFDGGVNIRDTIYSLVPYTTGGKTYMTLEPIP